MFANIFTERLWMEEGYLKISKQEISLRKYLNKLYKTVQVTDLKKRLAINFCKKKTF